MPRHPRHFRYGPDQDLDEIAAGDLIRARILRIEPTVSRWRDQHTRLETGRHALGKSTVLDICDGTYNAGAGVSVRLLWRVCLEIESGDAHCARMLAHAYLVALGLVPHSGEASLASEMSVLNQHVHRVASAFERHVRKAEAAAKRAEKRDAKRATMQRA